jgi:uncharacterized protein DUF4166
MGAGPVPELLHRAQIGLAWLVRWRILPSPLPFAQPIHFVSNHVAWGEHRGGMFVEVEGKDSGNLPVKRSWHLLAEGDDGPLIPSTAVEAIVRRMPRGHPPQPGARAAVRDVELEDYEELFARRTIYTGVRDDRDGPTLYRRALGTSWQTVPTEVRALHDGTDVPVRVDFVLSPSRESWTRHFDGHSFSSSQFMGTGRSDLLLCERFGPLTFAIALVPDGGRLHLVLRRWTAFGVPMPAWLCPRSATYEAGEDGRFCFRVEISHRLTGLVVRYRGWLKPS